MIDPALVPLVSGLVGRTTATESRRRKLALARRIYGYTHRWLSPLRLEKQLDELDISDSEFAAIADIIEINERDHTRVKLEYDGR